MRIFVEMESAGQAEHAVVALNGRFFDQKVISATFYDESRFQKMDLAPLPDEL